MRWEDLPQSDNVEDRRGDGGYGGGGGGGFPMGGGGLGIGTIVVLGIVGWALGIDPRLLIGGAEILTGGQQHRAADARAAVGTGQRRDRALRARRARQHRGAVEGSLRQGRPDLSRAASS